MVERENMKIGIDLGGSHIGIGVVDEQGKIIEKTETELANTNNVQEFIVNKIENDVANYINKYNNIEMIGIASPGTPKEGKLTNIVNLGIKELNITEILESKFNIQVKVKMMLNVQLLQKRSMEH